MIIGFPSFIAFFKSPASPNQTTNPFGISKNEDANESMGFLTLKRKYLYEQFCILYRIRLSTPLMSRILESILVLMSTEHYKILDINKRVLRDDLCHRRHKIFR